ncbi:hypothetical protein MCAV_04110 [[Mycoplasma] cavipharyngis]
MLGFFYCQLSILNCFNKHFTKKCNLIFKDLFLALKKFNFAKKIVIFT